jgi:hypothetical protein
MSAEEGSGVAGEEALHWMCFVCSHLALEIVSSGCMCARTPTPTLNLFCACVSELSVYAHGVCGACVRVCV